MTTKSWALVLGLLFAALLAVAGLALLKPSRALNVLAALDSLRVAEGAAYGLQPRQRYDLYRPAGAAPVGGWPLVVFFYGGAWNRGERAEYRFVGEALAARGLMVMLADYRLHPQVRYPDFLRDCAAAAAVAIDQAAAWGADPARIYLMGHSAGAYNAAMLALDGRWLEATGHRRSELAGWVGLAGPYDFLPIKTPEVQAAFHHPDVPLDSQPLHHAAHAARGLPGQAPPLPALLVAGSQDQRVDPLRNTRGLALVLREAGASVRLREYQSLDHETVLGALARPLQRLAPVMDEVADFVGSSAPQRALAQGGG